MTLPALILSLACSATSKLEAVQVAKDGRSFVLASSGRPFVPWGFNYGAEGRLLEDYWATEWPRVVKDFQDMRRLGANVVRIHLQVGKFLDGPDRPHEKSLNQLGRLLQLAEETGLYLDVTGLGCYRKSDVPAWYDALSESERWAVQAHFWEAISARCSRSSAVFCYDLMNEPIVPGGRRKPGDWLSGKPLGGFDFVQFITLDQAGRPRDAIARQWIRKLADAIHKHDRKHPITVGLLPWIPKWGHLSGFVPKTVAPELDFISVHLYPEKDKVQEAIKSLKEFAVGKPLVIEETFPLACSTSELRDFLLQSKRDAAGWIGHYFGQTPEQLEELRRSKTITIAQAITLDWLKLFRDLKPEMLGR